MGQFQNMEIVQIILSCIICAFEELIESWLTVNQKLFKIQFDRIIYLKKSLSYLPTPEVLFTELSDHVLYVSYLTVNLANIDI